MRKLVIYTRGGPGWGMGHLHRVSWMLEELSDIRYTGSAPAEAIVACVDTPAAREFWYHLNAVVRFIPEQSLTSLPELNEGAGAILVDWLDSIASEVEELSGSGSRVVLLDEYGPAAKHAGLVINSLLCPIEDTESVAGRAAVLSGLKWLQLPRQATVLRRTAMDAQGRATAKLAGPPPWKGPVRGIMVSFGGGPQKAFTELALDALNQCRYEGRVIVMPSPDGTVVPPGLDVELKPAGTDFHDLLSSCDLAICGAGLTVYEAAFLGVPALALAVRSEIPGRELHQLDTTAKLARAGCAVDLGLGEELDVARLAGELDQLLGDDVRRGKMSASGMRLIDGGGLGRTVFRVMQAARWL